MTPTENKSWFCSCGSILPRNDAKILEEHKQLGHTKDQRTIDEIRNKIKQEAIRKNGFDENGDMVAELVGLISKTVKEDEPLIYNILFCCLSSFTDKPSHLMVMEKTSEGKTYPALEIAKLFPKEHVILLGSATPQTFKYEPFGILVNENYVPIQEEVDFLDKAIEEARASKKTITKLEKQKGELFRHSKTLFDLREKVIVFKEPPDHKLLEALYSTLSSDEEYNEHKFVNKTGSGQQRNFTVVFRGTPAMLICTARDETKNKRWSETASRFSLVSPISSEKKYLAGMGLISKRAGLPSVLFKEHVISDEDIIKQKEIVKKLIELIRNSKGEIFNPFIDEIASQFPRDVGTRWRQFQRFMTAIQLHALCYSNHRPKLIIGKQKIPVVTLSDVSWAIETIKDQTDLPPNKIKWYNEVFLEAYKDLDEKTECKDGKIITNTKADEKAMICNDIVVYLSKKGKRVNAKQIRETYLEPLVDYGYIESDIDPNNRTRFVYKPSYVDLNNNKSPLNVVSSLNASCVKLCLDKYLQRRFIFEYNNKSYNQEEIIPLLLSVENVITTHNIEPKNTNDELEMNDV